MALQLRRGTDAERSAVTFADGELVYTTDTKKLYVGDGATAGGNSITSPTTLDGDLTGSVFGDDSTLIVDGVNNSINTSSFTSPSNIHTFSSDTTAPFINLKRKSNGNISANGIQYGGINFGKDDSSGSVIHSVIYGLKNELVFGNDSTGLYSDNIPLAVLSDGKLSIGGTTPLATLDVRGDAIIHGFVQFGSLTTVQRNALTAANGMVIYNSTDNKFQGYENGAWVNLI